MRTDNQKITDPVLDTYLAFALNLDSLRFAVKAEMHAHDLSPTDGEVDAIIGERLGVGTDTIEQLQASTGVDCGCGEDCIVAVANDIQPNTFVDKQDGTIESRSSFSLVLSHDVTATFGLL